MNVRRHRRLLISAAAVTAGVVTLAACGSGSGSSDAKSGDKLQVTASFYPMEFLAEEIGGDQVEVTTLTEPGVEPHDLEITPKQTAQVGEADMVLYLKDFQPAVDETVEQAEGPVKVDAAELTTLETHGTSEDGHAHEGESEEEHAGHSHEESGTDPHFWLDPAKYAEVAEGVGEQLAKADPDNAKTYEKNTDALVEQLNALDKEYEEGLKDVETDTFITTHAAFGYLADAYGLHEEAISGLDPEAEPSPARMKELQEVAEHDNATTVFYETLASDKTAKSLAGDTGLKTDVLDPVEGITEKSKGDDYFEVMESNLTALETALGAK